MVTNVETALQQLAQDLGIPSNAAQGTNAKGFAPHQQPTACAAQHHSTQYNSNSNTNPAHGSTDVSVHKSQYCAAAAAAAQLSGATAVTHASVHGPCTQVAAVSGRSVGADTPAASLLGPADAAAESVDTAGEQVWLFQST